MLRCAQRYRVDGMICGHIHHPNELMRNGIAYLNDGDGVEHCTVRDGRLQLVDWPEEMQQLAGVEVARLPQREAA